MRVQNKQFIKGDLSLNYTSWDEPTRDWNTYIEKLLPKILGRLGRDSPSKRRFFLRAYDTSVVRYVYAFRNYLSECLRQSGTPPSAAWCHTTLKPAFLGTFQAWNIGECYTKKLFRSSSIILATPIFWREFPFSFYCAVMSIRESYINKEAWRRNLMFVSRVIRASVIAFLLFLVILWIMFLYSPTSYFDVWELVSALWTVVESFKPYLSSPEFLVSGNINLSIHNYDNGVCRNKFRRFSQLYDVISVFRYGLTRISSANRSLRLSFK